ncbi:flavin reductase family protein [Kitasatospora sp. NPDC048365]|uniref:flavin reductase family protein n=1 Tax=Kitasatospora sp. NPDC048365 TaxID=3364050 RepID=UPI003722655C
MQPYPIDPGELREAMGRWPSGVTVVTTADPTTGRPWGFTATSFTSLSMRPPLVLVCLDLGAECRPAFQRAAGFAVHILRSGQRGTAERFATRGVDKFADGVGVRRGLYDVPLLDGAAATLECRLTERLPGGDHLILIGAVQRVTPGPDEPLLYHRRAFVELPAPVLG